MADPTRQAREAAENAREVYRTVAPYPAILAAAANLDALAAQVETLREAMRNIAHTDDAAHARRLATLALAVSADNYAELEASWRAPWRCEEESRHR